MATKSLADSIQARLQADTPSTSTNLSDLEWNFYSPQSGLTPASKYSITDHKLAYYKLQGAYSGSIRDVETAYFKSQGAVGASYDDLRFDFYTNRQFFLPNALANLELWLEADNVSGAVLASDNFDRSKNLLAGNDPSFEGGTAGGWNNPGGNNTTVASSTAWTNTGTRSLLVTATAAGDVYTEMQGTLSTLKPSTPYTFSVTIKNNAAAARNFQLYLIGQSGYRVLGNSSAVSLAAGEVRRLVLTITSPSVNTTDAFVRVDMVNATTADTYAIDDFQLEQNSKATAFVWGDATHLGTTDQGLPYVVAQGAMPWGISGGTANTTGDGGNDTIATVDTGINDHTVSITASVGRPGVVFRCTDGANYYFLGANGGFGPSNLSLYKRVASVYAQIGASLGSVQAGDTLTASIQGNTLILSRNGTVVFNNTDNSLATGTRAGIWASAQNGVPTSIDNLSIKTPIYSDGAALPIWPDKSGYGRHVFQTGATQQPLFKTVGGSNGKPRVLFDGVNDVLTQPGNLLAKAPGVSMFVVRACTALPSANATIVGQEVVTKLQVSALSQSGFVSTDGATWAASPSWAQAPDNSWHSQEVISDSTLYIDGVSRSSAGPVSSIGTNGFPLAVGGKDNGPVEPFNGSIAAVLVFSRALSTTERQQVERYLRNKYALP